MVVYTVIPPHTWTFVGCGLFLPFLRQQNLRWLSSCTDVSSVHITSAKFLSVFARAQSKRFCLLASRITGCTTECPSKASTNCPRGNCYLLKFFCCCLIVILIQGLDLLVLLVFHLSVMVYVFHCVSLTATAGLQSLLLKMTSNTCISLSTADSKPDLQSLFNC